MSQVYLMPSNIVLTKNYGLDPICTLHAKSSGILSTRGWFTFKTRPCHPPFKTFRTLQWGLWIQFLELFVDVPKKCYWSPFLSFWLYNSLNFLFHKFFWAVKQNFETPCMYRYTYYRKYCLVRLFTTIPYLQSNLYDVASATSCCYIFLNYCLVRLAKTDEYPAHYSLLNISQDRFFQSKQCLIVTCSILYIETIALQRNCLLQFIYFL